MTKLAFVLEDGRELQVPLAADMPLGRLIEVTAAVHETERLHEQRVRSLEEVSSDHLQMTARLHEVTARHHELSAEVHLLQAQEFETRRELADISARLAETLAAAQKLAGRRAMEEERLAHLEQRADQLNQQMNQATADFTSRQEELESVERSLSRAQLRLSQAEQQADARETQLAETLDALAAGRLELRFLEREGEGLRAQNAELRQSIADAETRLADGQARVEDLAASLAALEASHTAARELQESLDCGLRATTDRLEATQEELQSVLDATAAGTAEFRQTARSLDTARAQLLQSEAGLQDMHGQTEACLQKLVQAQAEESGAQARLAATQARLERITQLFTDTALQLEKTQAAQGEAADLLSGLRQEAGAMESLLTRLRQAVDECEPRQQKALARLTDTEQCLERVTTSLLEKEAARAALQAGLEALHAEIQQGEGRLVQQQSDAEAAWQRVHELEQRQQGLNESLEALRAGEKAERARYEELRDLAQTVSQEHEAQKQALASRLECARQELADTEARMQALQSWGGRITEATRQLSQSAHDSPEAGRARNEIEIALAGLRHVLSHRPGSLAPASSAPSLTAPASQAPPVRENADAALLSTRLNRLRETLQREEARLQHVQRERARLEARPRATSPLHGDPALRDKDQKLEEKIRLNEARLELLEARLRRGLEDEKRQKEKLATLAQQLAEMRAEFCAKPALVPA